MTSMANAFRKAMGQPIDNSLPENFKPKEKSVFDDHVAQEHYEALQAEEEQTIEINNEMGLPEFGFYANSTGKWTPVCSQCGAYTRPNTGQGTMCDKCIHEDIMESSHDLDN